MINATNTSTAPSSNPARMPVVVRSPAPPREPAQAERTNRSAEVREVPEVRDVRRGHHHHAHRGGRRESADPSGEAFATLKIKIQQTVASLIAAGTDETDAPSTDGAPGPGSEGVLKFSAKIRMSGPDGTLDAQLKLRLDGGSAADGGGFAAAVQGFTQALFSALQALYGGARPALEAPPVAAAAPSSGATTTTVATPVVADNAGEDTTIPTPAPAASEALSPNGSRAVSVRLRLSYDAFGSNLGSLVNQLAQPEGSSAAAGMTAWLDDLGERFGQMMSLAPNSGAEVPTLDAFLTALARSLFGAGSETAVPSGETALVDTPVPEATPAAPVTTTATLAPPTAQRFVAMAEYRQVVSYGDAALSVLLQGGPRGSALYGLA
jgi:hypothetical protein